VLSVEDWAEIRRLRRAEQLPIAQIARVLGISRNTVKAALASDGPPKYQRPPAGSVADAFEPRIRELLQAFPQMPSTVIAGRIGWPYSIRTLSGKVAELRPVYLPPDPAGRTVYLAGEIAQHDFWFPPVELPVGSGQVRTAKQLPVLTMITGYARFVGGLLTPSRGAQDLFAGWWRLLERLGAVPRTLVWDGEGAVGRYRRGGSALTAETQAFRGVLGAKVIICKPADPEAKGLLERVHGYLWRPRSCPGARSPGQPTSTPSWVSSSQARTGAGGGRWAAPHLTGSLPTSRRCCHCRRWRPRRAGGSRCGCHVTTTCAWTPTTTR
jgi:transposase